MALEQLSSGLFATQRHFSPVVALKQLSLGFMGCYLLHRDTLVLGGHRIARFRLGVAGDIHRSCVAPEQLSSGFMNP